jgi:nitrogen fixation-related uncharacterized protein
MITLFAILWILATASLAFAGTGYVGRAILVCLVPVALSIGALLVFHLWTGPKPYQFEHRSGPTELLAREFREGDAIYMWLRWEEGDATPRAYRFDWSEELAQQIEEAESEVAKEGGQVQVTFPEELLPGGDAENPPPDGEMIELELMLSLEDRPPPIVHAVPQPKPPAKPPPPPQRPVFEFNNGWGGR